MFFGRSVMDKEINSSAKEENSGKKTIVLSQEKEEKFAICDVCGYANPHKATMCKMCSNYLKGLEV